MEIIKNEENVIIKKGTLTIETYNFAEEISFSKLAEYLLGLNLTSKIDITNKIEEPTTEEESLIKLIKNIISNYNQKVDELKEFQDEYVTKNKNEE